MTDRKNFGHFPALLICLAGSFAPAAAQKAAEEPETVMVTLHAKPGAEADLERVIAQHWSTARQLNLVRPVPHVTLRGSEDGNKTYFIDVFTWRDAHIPDAAPADIQKIWNDMNRLVEARGGHAGLEFAAVSVVAP